MPNWCVCKLKLTGDPDQIQQFIQDVKGPEEALDFEKLLPMPPELEAVGSPLEIVSQEEREKFIASHPDWAANGLGYPITQAMADDYIKRFGAPDWYTWAQANWGCKWPASESIFEGAEHTVHIPFGGGERKVLDGTYIYQTPWSPGTEFFVRISPRYPGVIFEETYCEPGNGFCGVNSIQDGNFLVKEEHDTGSPRGKELMAEFGFEEEEA